MGNQFRLVNTPLNQMVPVKLKGLPAMALGYGLTGREGDVLVLIATGLPNKAVAERLSLSVNTVSHHLKNIFRKMRVNSRAGAVGKLLASASASTPTAARSQCSPRPIIENE